MNKPTKIIKCSKDTMWYKDHIGETYEEVFIDEDGSSVVSRNEDASILGSILKGDFEYE